MPTVLSLPDELLARILAHILCFPPPLAAGAPAGAPASSPLAARVLATRAADAFAFAQTCRRVLRVFAHTALASLAPHVHAAPPASSSSAATARVAARVTAGNPAAAVVQLHNGPHNHAPAQHNQAGLLHDLLAAHGQAAADHQNEALLAALANVPHAAQVQAAAVANVAAMMSAQDPAGVPDAAVGAAAAQAVAFAAANEQEAVDAVAHASAAAHVAEQRLGGAAAPTASVRHVRAMIRLAGVHLHALTVDAHPPDRPRGYHTFLPAFPVERQGSRAVPLDPAALLDEVVARPAGVGACNVLRLVHPRPLYSQRAAIALWRFLRARGPAGLRTLHLYGAETRMGRAALMAALGGDAPAAVDGGSSAHARAAAAAAAADAAARAPGDDAGEWAALYLRRWKIPSSPLGASAVPVVELHLPAFAGGYQLLAALIETFGPTLRKLELSVLTDAISNLPSAPPPRLGSEADAFAFFSRVAARCPHLTDLRQGNLVGGISPLGLCLVQVSAHLRTLTLDRMTGDLADPRCHAMAIIRAAQAACPDLREIHMIDCLVTGESSELFAAVGTRLRSFTGSFSWETSDELLIFSHHCPNVESLSLRCGDMHPDSPCDEGALQACKRFGTKLRNLIICNLHISEASFLDAVCAATSLTDLELVCNPKLSVEHLRQILAAVGANLRSLTIAWPRLPFQTAVHGDVDHRILDVVANHCPLLQSLCIPELWYDAEMMRGTQRLEAASAAVESLQDRLPHLDWADCTLYNHLKHELLA